MKFGPFHLGAATQSLFRGTTPIDLTPKSFAVLRYLIEHRGRLVSKSELFDVLWAGRVVSDAALKVCIREIRKQLDDSVKQPRFIETRHRLGYRFIGAVSTEADGHAEPFPAQASQPAHSPLVGRDTALAQLHRHLAAAQRGESRLAFVTGETGIGKTTLVHEFLRALDPASSMIAYGQSVEQFDAAEPYLAVLEALSMLARSPAGDKLAGILARVAPTWLAQMPFLVDLAQRRLLVRDTLGANRGRMLRELADALAELAGERTFVLVLDDLHWSDAGTVDLVSFLGSARPSMHLLLIGTYRPADLSRHSPAFQAALQELQSHGRCGSIPLGFWSEPDVREFIRRRYGSAGPLDTLARELHARTEGNPMFVVSVLDYLQAQSVLLADRGQWQLSVPIDAIDFHIPGNLQQLIARQMDRLSAMDHRFLEFASVCAPTFSADEAAAVLGGDATDIDEHYAALARAAVHYHRLCRSRWRRGTP